MLAEGEWNEQCDQERLVAPRTITQAMALPGKGVIRVASRIQLSLSSLLRYSPGRIASQNSISIVPIADTARTKAHTARIHFSLSLLPGTNERKGKRQLNRKGRSQTIGRAHEGSSTSFG